MKCTEFDAAIAARHGNLARVDATVKDDVAMTLCQAILRITHRLNASGAVGPRATRQCRGLYCMGRIQVPELKPGDTSRNALFLRLSYVEMT